MMFANLKNYTTDILSEIEISLNIGKDYGICNILCKCFSHPLNIKVILSGCQIGQ